ncbi:hypothetical protein [Alishewanella sp. HL-SH05]|uniref:hypothetical protein n=1 Tax=Alishewanella sp. HL-SH05 TaxID=3461145 RepID=UPI00404244B8
MNYLKSGMFVFTCTVAPFLTWYLLQTFVFSQCDPKFGCFGTFKLFFFILILWGLLAVVGHISNLFIQSIMKGTPLKANNYMVGLFGFIYGFGHLSVFSYHGIDLMFIFFALLAAYFLSLVSTLIK